MKDTSQPYRVFSIAMDELQWTRHWLKDKRCDQLLVFISASDEVQPRLHIRAVESKTTDSTEPLSVSPEVEPFREGISQVTATLECLSALLRPVGKDSFVEDMQFSTFIEHLATVALASLYPFSDRATSHVISVISRLARRDPDVLESLSMDATVVVTQYRATIPRQVVTVEDAAVSQWPVRLVRLGIDALDTLIGRRPRSAALTTASVSDRRSFDRAIEVQYSIRGETAEPAIPVAAEHKGTPSGDTRTSAVRGLATDVYLACQHRGFQVSPPLPENIVVGPSLVSVSMALKPGASIRPIEAACEDLAREVGVRRIEVENDPDRPFHIRFIVARRDREFPSLPQGPAPFVDAEKGAYGGLYLGQDITGKDYLSYLSTWPHMLIGGTTGSGKTTFVRSILKQLGQCDPRFVQVIVIDGKGETDYIGVLSKEHFPPPYRDVLLGSDGVLDVLDWLVTTELPRRRSLLTAMAQAQGRSIRAAEALINSYRQGDAPPFPVLVVVIDEFAELMLETRNSSRFEDRVQQIAQGTRSVMIHLVLATQRPDASVIRPAIKANLPARVALQLPTHHDSQTILGGAGAERLLGSGDLLFRDPSMGAPIRLQGYNA